MFLQDGKLCGLALSITLLWESGFMLMVDLFLEKRDQWGGIKEKSFNNLMNV